MINKPKHFKTLLEFQAWLEDKYSNILDNPNINYVTLEWNGVGRIFEIDFWNKEPRFLEEKGSDFSIWVSGNSSGPASFDFIERDEIVFDFPVKWNEFIFEAFV